MALREALRFHGLLPAAFVLGFSRDKDHAAMAEALRGLGPVVLTRYASPRSEDPRALLPLFPGAKVVEDPPRPWRRPSPGRAGWWWREASTWWGRFSAALRGFPPRSVGSRLGA